MVKMLWPYRAAWDFAETLFTEFTVDRNNISPKQHLAGNYVRVLHFAEKKFY